MKKYNRTLLVALLIVAVFATAIGGTFAWFTDNVEVTGNVIESGTLDIDIELKKGDSWISLERNPETKIYNYDLWEPGYTQVETMKIVNKGNLALQYELNVVPGPDQKFGPNGESLAEQIEVYMSFGEFTASAENAAETREFFHKAKDAGIDKTVDGNRWWYCGTLDNMITRDEGFTGGVLLPASETSTTLPVGSVACTIALHMDEDAGNEYQNLSLGTAGFKLQAKQYTYEPDSFDNQYDKDAVYGEGSIVNGDIPPATITPIADDELPSLVTVYDIDSMNKIGRAALDVGFTFTAEETVEEAALSPYAQWHADFVVTLDQNTAANSCGLAGQYTSWSDEWLGFNLPVDATPTDSFRLLKDSKGIQLNYVDLCDYVKVFNCGVYNLRDENVGTKVTVQLRLYEPATDATNVNSEGETGEYVVVSTHVYTLEPVQETNRDITDDQ